SAAGLTNVNDGLLVLISTKKMNAGDIATYLVNNHRVQTALKFDGGGSVSMAWVNSDGKVDDFCAEPLRDPDTDELIRDPVTGEVLCRAVAEGLLIFSEKIQPTSTVDVALIIDSSGSMTSNDPGNKRLEAARAYLTASLAGDFVGIVDFDSSVRLASPLLRLPENKTTLVNAINTINSSGGTNIGIGVQEGCKALINSASENTIKAAILLTDGQGAFAGQDVCFGDRGWPIYTFGFGSANDALLQQIASNTGGEFARLPTSNLVCEFQRVRSKIAGVEPGPCTVIHIGPLEIVIFIVAVASGQEQVSFSTSWTGSDVEMALTTPSGRVIDRNTVAPDVIHDLGSTFEIYTVLNPELGDWEVSLFGADVPPGGEDVVLGTTTVPLLNQTPTAKPNGPYLANEGEGVIFDGTGSSDPDGDTLTFSWDFGDGTTGDGPTPTHTYADNGDYIVTLTV
ncbi:MAG: PKD domain-containing protein, partial [Anaerolineae bacterium]|nr:PKD domain-containing protein [Anaerolineae bacterium]